MGIVDAGDDQHRHRVGVGLRHGGDDIGHAGPGDDEAGGRFAGGARVAVGHEAGALFVARRDVAQARVGQPAVEFDGMHARNAEDDFDAIGLQQLDQYLAAGFELFVIIVCPCSLLAACTISALSIKAVSPAVDAVPAIADRGPFRAD